MKGSAATRAAGHLTPHWSTIWPLALGVLAALVALPLAALEWAWIGFIVVALGCAVAWLSVADKERLLTGLFILSLQAGASYRLWYGRAGSEGVAFPLSIVVGTALIVWWWSTGKLQERTPAPAHLRPLALVLLATSAVSFVTSSERFVVLTHLVFELELFAIYWIALHLVRSLDELERVIRLLLLTLAIQSVIYVLQSHAGLSFTLEGDLIEQDAIPRPGGTVSTNPAGFASFIIPLLMIAIARFADRERRDAGVLLLGVIALGCVAVGLTFTRVAWAGLCLALTWLMALGYRRRAVRQGMAAAVAAGAVVVGLVMMPLMSERLVLSPVAEAYDERAGLMRIALEVIAHHPLTGIGTGAYSQRFKEYLPADFPDQWLYTVHNEYLLRAAETGIPGAIAFVVLLGAGFWLAVRLTRDPTLSVRTTALGWSAGLLALLWQMYWVPWRGFEYNALLWFLLGISDAMRALSAHHGIVCTEMRRGALGAA